MANELKTEFTKEQLISKPKNQVFNIFMLHGLTRVWLNPDGPDVAVPDHLKGREAVILELGYDLVTPIPDLMVSPYAFEATLLFSGQLFTCVVPWDSVLAITDGNGLGVYYGQKTTPKETIDETVKKEKRKMFTVLKGGKN
jgi:hypothetical protein